MTCSIFAMAMYSSATELMLLRRCNSGPGSIGSKPAFHLPNHRHQKITAILGRRTALLGKTLGNICADRLRCPANLIRHRELLDLRKSEASLVHFQRYLVGTPKDLKVLERRNAAVRLRHSS